MSWLGHGNPDDHGIALRVDDVTKTFKVYDERATSLKQFIAMGGRNKYEEFEALRNVSFEVPVGEAVGIIGHNGSGKSTLLKCMAKILTPNAGSITINKRMAALLELGAGFHPELSGRDNVFLNAAILGMSRPDIARRFDDIVAFSELERFIDTPVKTYSSGMYVRLAFAVAINVDPDLLLIDEILAVGDVTFQQKCMEKFVQFRNEGRTLVLVTHDTSSVRNFCDRAIWIDHGEVKADGSPADVIDEYTETMLEAQAAADGSMRRGDGPLRVTKVDVLVSDTRMDRVRTGDDVTFRVHFETPEPVANPVFSLSIASLTGIPVTAPSSRDARAVPVSVDGKGHVDIAVRDLSLIPGSYTIHTEVSGWSRQHLYDHLQHARTFDVLAGDSSEIDGLVTLRPTWTWSGDGVSSEIYDRALPPSPDDDGIT
ncbi:ABC transporter ATP-binding protein [Ilumatobacter nonamiensis]|uniref:ABC transporter ATP-binding protein n=1 Tax=Ilumatobacter nonamiensis TaxID=467093 RepID=UPI000346F980|nr:ABC transporter ATP-binding protein [Ilumatobacter nonamiensis]